MPVGLGPAKSPPRLALRMEIVNFIMHDFQAAKIEKNNDTKEHKSVRGLRKFRVNKAWW